MLGTAARKDIASRRLTVCSGDLTFANPTSTAWNGTERARATRRPANKIPPCAIVITRFAWMTSRGVIRAIARQIRVLKMQTSAVEMSIVSHTPRVQTTTVLAQRKRIVLYTPTCALRRNFALEITRQGTRVFVTKRPARKMLACAPKTNIARCTLAMASITDIASTSGIASGGAQESAHRMSFVMSGTMVLIPLHKRDTVTIIPVNKTQTSVQATNTALRTHIWRT